MFRSVALCHVVLATVENVVRSESYADRSCPAARLFNSNANPAQSRVGIVERQQSTNCFWPRDIDAPGGGAWANCRPTGFSATQVDEVCEGMGPATRVHE